MSWIPIFLRLALAVTLFGTSARTALIAFLILTSSGFLSALTSRSLLAPLLVVTLITLVFRHAFIPLVASSN